MSDSKTLYKEEIKYFPAFTEVTETVVELERTDSLCRLLTVLLSQTNSLIKMKANKFYI